MASFKKLSTQDVFVVPYVANKKWNLDFNCVPQDGAYFTIYKGKNLTGSIDLVNGPVTEGQYESLVYRNINHLYYQYASSSTLNSHSLQDSLYYNSAPTESGTILTGSYFNFNEDPEFISDFPTGSNDFVRVMKFNQNIYGEQIKPNCFVLTAPNSFQLVDDGYGNVYDIYFTGYYVQQGYYAPPGYIADLNNKVFVGNIFYSQGIVVITNPNYKCFLPTPPNAVNDYFRILNVQRVKQLNVLSNDYIDCISTNINTGSIATYSYPNYSFPLFTIITGSLYIDECETLGVTPGNYKLYYTVNDDTCLRSNTASIDLELYKLPLVLNTLSSQSYVCPGGVANVTFSINYGIPPYQYSIGGSTWNNLNNCEWYQPTASTSAVTGDVLYVRDSEGTIVSQSLNITTDVFTVNISSINVSCGGSGNGKIAVTGSSSFGAPYSASINGGSTWQGFTTNTLFSNLTPATYTVTVKDNICTTSSLVTITQPTALSVVINSTSSDCPEVGQDVGAINITVSGGTAPYTYSWTTGSTVVRTTEDPTGLPAGTYVVTVTDASSCTVTGSATINSVSPISVNLTTTNGSCSGSGQISSSVSGGSGTGFSYLWNTGATGSIITGSVGTYTLTVTDLGTGCTFAASASLSSSAGFTNLSSSLTYNECDTSVNIGVTGGTSPYTYVVQKGGTTLSQGPTTTNPISINLNDGLNGGTWNITVADANGCVASGSVNVRAREYRYSDPACQELNAVILVDESSGVGTNLKVKANSQDVVTLFTTDTKYIQLHSGTLYSFEAPIYVGDNGWSGSYPSASHTMSVYATGSLTYTTSSIETGSAYWPYSSFTAESSKYYLVKVESNLATGSTPPPPSGSVCYTTVFGTVPVTGGGGSYATGSIVVTGGNVNVWAKYNSGGSSSGNADFSLTINGVTATGTFVITSVGQTFYSDTQGTSNGYITLTPGTYGYTLVKTDNLTSGNEVRLSWNQSTVANPTLSSNMGTCTNYYSILGPVSGLSGTSGGACANYFSSRAYYSNVNFFQSNVTYIYEDTGLTTPLNTGGQWKPLSFNGVALYAVVTNSSGMVTNYTSC